MRAHQLCHAKTGKSKLSQRDRLANGFTGSSGPPRACRTYFLPGVCKARGIEFFPGLTSTRRSLVVVLPYLAGVIGMGGISAPVLSYGCGGSLVLMTMAMYFPGDRPASVPVLSV